MEKKRIYPFLIDEKRMAGYYELLLEDKFKLKVFDKNKDEKIYNYFLPCIREYLFWSFHLKDEISEYNKIKNDLKAAICSRYACNIFEKDENTVICFNTGVCFAVTEDDKLLKRITKFEKLKEMEAINLRSTDVYELSDNKEEHKYAYILELYKLIYLNKLNNELQNPDLFDKARDEFVNFTQKLYAVQETDKDKYCSDQKEKLDLEKLYISVENQFDLLYKNNKLNENLIYKRFILILLVILIIIGIINLGNWIA